MERRVSGGGLERAHTGPLCRGSETRGAPPVRRRHVSREPPVQREVTAPVRPRYGSPIPHRPRAGSGSPVPLFEAHLPVVAAQLSGFYLVKFAVSATACYLTIQLLITFAEVLLPFIFAVLCCIVLEPLKRFIMRTLQRLVVLLLKRLHWHFCLESRGGGPRAPSEGGYRSDGELGYGGLPEDSEGEAAAAAAAALSPCEVPVPAVKKAILAISILICILLSGRVLWLTAKVFFRAAGVISENIEVYKDGSNQLKAWFQGLVVDLHLDSSDANKLLDGIVKELEDIGTVVTQGLLYTVLQAVVTFIFLIYMLWSPIRMESSSMTREVFTSTSRYLKVKCLISALTGLAVAILLCGLGLDLPAAFGLLAFLANFLPGIGSFVASLLPCILASIDSRKKPPQVLLALVLQFAVHFCVDFVIEPVFFGISVEIHSVVVILGIWFFYQVWGVPGMLLSVPLLAVARVVMRSLRQASKASAEDTDTIVFLDNILEGRWMSTVGERGFYEEIELAQMSAATWTLAESDTASPTGSRRGENLDLWALARNSQLGGKTLQFYQNNRLLVDCVVLLLILGIVMFIPY